MQQVRDYLVKLYNQVNKHIEDIGKADKKHTRPFFTLERKIASVGNILDAYMRGHIQFKTEEAVREFVKLLLRDLLFVASLSAIEYELLISFPHACAPYTSMQIRKQKSLREIKLTQLIQWIANDQLIGDKYLWDYAIAVRNDIVHYDAFARSTMASPPQLEFDLIMEEGKQILGKHRSFIALTLCIEQSFYELICKVI